MDASCNGLSRRDFGRLAFGALAGGRVRLGRVGMWASCAGGGGGGYDPTRTFAALRTGAAASAFTVYTSDRCTIDWGDGDTTETTDGGYAYSHTYAAAGSYVAEVFKAGGVASFGLHAGQSTAANTYVDSINVGDSVTSIVRMECHNALSGVRRILGMGGVTGFLGPVVMPTLTEFEFPPLVTDLAVAPNVPAFSFGGATRFSFSNVMTCRPPSGTSSGLVGLSLPCVETVDMSGFTRWRRGDNVIVFASASSADNTVTRTVDYGAYGAVGTYAFRGYTALETLSHAGKLFAAHTNTLNHAQNCFERCHRLSPLPFDCGDDDSVSGELGEFGVGVFAGVESIVDAAWEGGWNFYGFPYTDCPNLEVLTVKKASLASGDVALNIGGPSARYPKLRKIVFEQGTRPNGLTFGNNIPLEEIVFDFHYASIIQRLASSSTGARLDVRFPYNTMAEVKAIKASSSASAAASFPFGWAAATPASRLAFHCSDGTMSAAGDVVA